MTKFLNISTDDTLGGNSPSDEVVSSQKALKTYIDNQGGGGSSYTAGTGIDITSDVISVTAPTLQNKLNVTNQLCLLSNANTSRLSSGNLLIGTSSVFLNGTSNVTAVGFGGSAYGSNSTFVGYSAGHTGLKQENNAVAIGCYANVGGNSAATGPIAIGSEATAFNNYAITIGYKTGAVAVGAIQIGHFIDPNNPDARTDNNDANTVKFGNANGNFEIMSADGTIPAARHADTTSAAQGQVLTLDANLKPQWATGGGGSVSWGSIGGTLSDQTDLNTALSGKQATITGAASSVVTNNLAAARAVISDGSGKLAASSTTSTEIGYVSGVTSSIQTQLNGKQATLTAGNGIDITSNTISVGDIDCGTLS